MTQPIHNIITNHSTDGYTKEKKKPSRQIAAEKESIETINTHAMMRLVLTLEEKQPKGEIYLIVDNASYNHSYALQLFLEDHSRTHLKYLPPYSPNLNIIERLWRFFHEKHRDKYFEKFKEFEQAVLTFFKNIRQHDAALKTLLTDSFQTLPV